MLGHKAINDIVSLIEKTGHKALSFFPLRVSLFVALCLTVSCKQNEQDLSKLKPYEGPFMESENIEHLYSDRAIIKVRMTAPKEEQMENEDLFWPEGIYLEFYNDAQVRTTTLKANKATYNKAKQLYIATGNVVVVDSVKTQTLNTEELHWDQAKQLFFTDKFVTIQTKKEVLKGNGLEAKQDMSSWRILSPTGVLPLNQQ